MRTTDTRGRLSTKRVESRDLVFDGLGATKRVHVASLFGTGHIMGTHRMGTDARDSVVDIFGRTHDPRQLVPDRSGVFPSGASANPTQTLAALALRTAAHIIDDSAR